MKQDCRTKRSEYSNAQSVGYFSRNVLEMILELQTSKIMQYPWVKYIETNI